MGKTAYALNEALPQALHDRLQAQAPAGHQNTLALCKTWLAEERDRLKSAFLRHGEIGWLLKEHSRVMDTLITELFLLHRREKTVPLVIVASGGYGRQELFPYSDIDLLFLHDGSDTKLAERTAETILYLLWDMGLNIGQSHRSVEETLALAGKDITVRTSLLDARPVAGDMAIFDRFQSHFRQNILSVDVAAFIEAKLAERDERHRRFGDSRYVLEPNVKEGKGGLRDLHTLLWLARYIYPIKTLKDLVGMGLLSREEYRVFDRAGHFLCRVRAHLHYLTGRPEERLTFDRQHALAAAMGYAHPEPHVAVLRFMRRYFAAVRMVGMATRIFCALLEDEKKRRPKIPLGWLKVNPWKSPGFKMEGERIGVRRGDLFEREPVKMLELFRLSQAHKLDIHPRALQHLSRSLPGINHALRQNARANALFLDVLLGEQNAEATLRRMNDAGVLGRFIPEFGRITGRTQFNMYHLYTVDEHTLVAIGILHAMENGALKKELPLACGILRRIQMRRALYVALFCHDLAKSKGQDHSEAGARLAAKLARRFGLSEGEAETAAWLVKRHLLFSDTAFKRDLSDPKTIENFATEVQSVERLKLLFVLTVADVRAVGASVWNAWKASLLEELYAQAEQAIGMGAPPLKTGEGQAMRRKLLKELPGWVEEEVDAYLGQGTAGFVAGLSAAQHAAIARMLKDAAREETPLLLNTEHDYERTTTEITVCTEDRKGLFCKLAGAMALSGANIIGAKIFTLKNGMAVDVFQVQDAAGDVFDRPDKLARMSVYIEQALSGELDLAETLTEQYKPYGRHARDAHPATGQVFIENEASNIHTVVEITGHDRPGLLYALTKTMAELDLSIASAHVSTYGTKAVDVFYVKDGFGMKLLHGARIAQVREALLAVVNTPAPVSEKG